MVKSFRKGQNWPNWPRPKSIWANRRSANRCALGPGLTGVSQFLSRRWAKHQAPSSKLQRNPGIEKPKTKLQTPKKSQIPSSKPRPALRAWSLELLWSLELGVWCLGPGASLELGAWNLELLLSTPFHKYDYVCCVDFRFWRGATREHPPKWGCDRGATKPEPKSDATLRAAVLFGPDVVARSLQTPEGYA